MTNNSTLDLPSGRQLHLRSLRQYITYYGMLEGLPTAERNKELLEQLVAEHSGKPYDGRPYLIQPAETPIILRDDERYRPPGTPSSLPAITCIACLQSTLPPRPDYGDFSGLVIIWFQDDYAFPINPSVAAQISAIDWESHAASMDYLDY